MDAVVGEDGVDAGHVEGCGVVGADGDGGGGAGVGDAGGVGEVDDLAVADLLGEGDGGDVEGVGDGGDGGDHAGVLAALEVAWAVRFAVEGEGGGVVVEAGEGGEGAVAVQRLAVQRGVEGGGVDEGLEDGAGGALGGGVIELGGGVVAAADEGENLAGVGVEGDEGDLGHGGRRLALFVLGADEVVDVAHAGFDGVGGGLLEVGVE